MKSIVKVTYLAYTDGGPMDSGHDMLVGYFHTLGEALTALQGLKPYDFDHYGADRIGDFNYDIIKFDDKKRDALIEKARTRKANEQK